MSSPKILKYNHKEVVTDLKQNFDYLNALASRYLSTLEKVEAGKLEVDGRAFKNARGALIAKLSEHKHDPRFYVSMENADENITKIAAKLVNEEVKDDKLRSVLREAVKVKRPEEGSLVTGLFNLVSSLWSAKAKPAKDQEQEQDSRIDLSARFQ